MICTQLNGHIKDLIRKLEILWKVELDDGTNVYSDYYIPYLDSPWMRLQKYCKENNRYITSVSCLMFGADEFIMFQNSEGLDGVFVTRGASKDIVISENGESGVSYKHLIVGVLSGDGGSINVRKFSWPENALEPFEQTRELTKNNLELMIFKNDERKEELLKKF